MIAEAFHHVESAGLQFGLDPGQFQPGQFKRDLEALQHVAVPLADLAITVHDPIDRAARQVPQGAP